MYTVVVADDEEEIRRSLIRKVNWNKAGFEVIGEAENGIEALELVEKLEPDLLLTDIRMPFISGIELARQVREIRPTMHIAFLSGFDDFSYAQQAIQYNIISYLLKPISSAELMEELQKIKEKIDQKFYEFTAQNQIQEKMEKSEFLMPLLLDGFQGGMTQESQSLLIKNAVSSGILQSDSGHLRFVVMVTMITDGIGKNETTRASVNAVELILHKYVKSTSIYVNGKVVSLLIATPSGFDKYLHILVEDLIQSVRRIMNLFCSIGVSRVVNTLESCHECYQEAMNAISYSNREKGDVHFITDEERTNNLDQEVVQKTINDIENLLRGGIENELREYLTGFFDSIGQGAVSQNSAEFILLQVISTVLKVVYAAAGNEAVQKLEKKFSLYSLGGTGSITYKTQFYIDICIAARELICDQRKKSSVMLCEQATRIIDEKYMNQDLSLVSVSAEIAVSPNYLSTLLKRDTGSTFKDLLTGKRIEKAKELLLFTSMKVREISEKCGYNDQHYFSYCFKKCTGVSPNVCRKSREEKTQG